MNIIHNVAHAVWASLPNRIRPYLLIEPLRLMLPKARNHSGEGLCFVVGFFSAPTGLGHGARLFLREKQEQGVKAYAVDVTRLSSSTPVAGLCDEAVPFDAQANSDGPGTVIVHANPPAFMAALWAVRKLLRGKRVVAYWAWELEDIPHYWRRCLDFLDEALTPSSFVATAVRKHTDKPVQVHPHAAFLPTVHRREQSEKRPFTVLCSFDCGANFYRKNPLAAVAAFKTAFGDDPNALLVLKAGNLERYPEGRRLLAKAADSPNIRFCLGNFSESGVDDLYTEADVYLSLHRSEGYGLTILEAMQRGVPVVATAWSGNMDFMRGEGVYPVPFTLVPVEDPQGTYNLPGARWAEADIEAAAEILRLLMSRAVEQRTLCVA